MSRFSSICMFRYLDRTTLIPTGGLLRLQDEAMCSPLGFEDCGNHFPFPLVHFLPSCVSLWRAVPPHVGVKHPIGFLRAQIDRPRRQDLVFIHLATVNTSLYAMDSFPFSTRFFRRRHSHRLGCNVIVVKPQATPYPFPAHPSTIHLCPSAPMAFSQRLKG